MLFVSAATVVALYLVGLVAFVVAVFVTIVDGSADRLGDWIGDLDVFPVLVIVVASLAVAGLLVAMLGWYGVPRTTLRFCRARNPRGTEAHRAQRTAIAFALSYGLRAPTIWVVDDPAPNALAFGRRAAGNICLTSGALLLPDEELEALTCYHVAALASRVFAYATSAADLVLFGEWCTRLLWASSAFVILAVVIGLPLDVAGAYVVGIGVLVVVTRPVLLLTDRGLVRLLDESNELVDLETIQHTNLPGAFARLLLDLLDDDRRARSRWEIVHLWFERDVVEAVGRQPTVYRQLAEFRPGDLTVPAFVERCAGRGRTGLLRRAEVAVQLAYDDRLRRRLVHARRAITH